MIYFLYGSDQYRLYQKVKEIMNRYQKVHQGSMNLVKLEAQGVSLTSLIDIARQPSMFIEHRLVVLKNPFGFSPALQRKLKKEISFLQSSPTVFLLYQEGEERKNDLFRELKKQAQNQSFPILDFSKTKEWLKKEAKRYALTFQNEALDKLARLIQGDLWRGHLYLEKIASYPKNSQVVDAPMVEKIVGGEEQAIDRFALANALQKNQRSKALKEVNASLDRGEAPEAIVGQLNSLLSRLLIVRVLLDEGNNQRQIQAKVSFNPKSVYFLARAAYSFRQEFLKRKIQDLFQIDLGIKTGRFAPREAINDFILRFPENA